MKVINVLEIINMFCKIYNKNYSGKYFKKPIFLTYLQTMFPFYNP